MFEISFLLQGAISGSFNLGNLCVSAEAIRLTYYVKVQLLLILIETLDLENLLQMIHDEIPFRYQQFGFSYVLHYLHLKFWIWEFLFFSCLTYLL